MASPRDIALLELQKIDTSLDRLKNDLENMPEISQLEQAKSRLEEIDQDAAAAEEQLAAAEHAQKKREDESARLDEKIKKEEKKLFSGTVSNPKELMSLQQEVKVLTDEKDTVDTEYLVGLDEIADILAKTKKLKENVAGLTTDVANLTEAAKCKKDALEREIQTTEEKRRIPLGDIDEMSLKTYEQMRVKGHGIAVVIAVESTCGGCNLENSEDSGHADVEGPVRRCEYCHRILITK